MSILGVLSEVPGRMLDPAGVFAFLGLWFGRRRCGISGPRGAGIGDRRCCLRYIPSRPDAEPGLSGQGTWRQDRNPE